jgi:hypothetical protein
LRSHSAPPVPRDGNDRTISANLGKETAQVSGKLNTVLSEDNITKVVDDVLPAVPKAVLHLEGRTQSRPPYKGANTELTRQGGLMSSSNNAEGATVAINENTKITSASPQKQLGASTPTTLSAPSPASSLEAILLDRKRRIQAHGSTPAQGTAGSTSGTRILASPVARRHDRTSSNALPPTTCDNLVATIPRPSSAPISKAKRTRFKSSRIEPMDLMGTSVLPMEESQDGLAEQNNVQDWCIGE